MFFIYDVNMRLTGAVMLRCWCRNQKIWIAMLPYSQDLSAEWLVEIVIDCEDRMGRQNFTPPLQFTQNRKSFLKLCVNNLELYQD